jgi:hypothetical protein
MKPEKDANELIFSFLGNDSGSEYSQAKQCAIVSCKHLIKEHTLKEPSRFNVERHNHWVNVLIEIKKFE